MSIVEEPERMKNEKTSIHLNVKIVKSPKSQNQKLNPNKNLLLLRHPILILKKVIDGGTDKVKEKMFLPICDN